MKPVRSQQGFTLVELLMAVAISVVLLGVLVSSILQTTRVTTHSSTKITAMEDIKGVARPITPDVRMAQTTVPATGTVANSLTLDWTSWYDNSSDPPELTPVDYHCVYTFLEAEGKVKRSCWEDWQGPNEQLSTATFGRYISGIEFSRHDIPEGTSYIQVVITSSPENRAETEEQMTYYINLHLMEEVPITS